MGRGEGDPRVVIGIPLYNGARYFAGALRSLLEQDGVALAIVLVDDGSTDGTEELARRLAASDDRVTFHRNERRLGLAGNWQRCLELAAATHPRAEYFAWGSDHDLWEPGWARALVAALDAAPDCVLAYPLTMRISADGRDVRPVPPFDTRDVRRPLRRYVRSAIRMSAGNMVYGLFRREPLLRTGGFPTVLLPDRLLLSRLALMGEFHQVPEVLWRRRLVATASLERQRDALFPDGRPWWNKLPVELVHAACLVRHHVLHRGAIPRRRAAAAAALTVALRVASKSNRRRLRRARLKAWRARKRLKRFAARQLRLLREAAHAPGWFRRAGRMRRAIGAWWRVVRGSYLDVEAHGLPSIRRPTREEVAAAAAASVLRRGPAYTRSASEQELRFREEIEPALRDEEVVDWLVRKEALPKLAQVLDRACIDPRGVVVELGAGSCWLSAALATRPPVERVFSVEFSSRRLEDLAPAAMAALGAPASKIHRVLADFHEPGVDPGTADLVVTDAAFHHSADPDQLARVAFDLLRPGGKLLLFREPTLSLLRRRRDHGLEGLHGDFENEYNASGYIACLRRAGFRPVRRVPAAGALTAWRGRLCAVPPINALNGIAFAEYAYVGVRPRPVLPGPRADQPPRDAPSARAARMPR